jgi:ABC-type multidrug transport system ATPase subunit
MKSTDGGPAFEVEGLTKTFHGGRVRACDDITLTIGGNSLTCLLGPNGAGKTTLIKQLMGLLRPDKGSIRLRGTSIVEHPTYARDACSYLPQSPYPFADVTAKEAIYFAARFRGAAHADAVRFADNELERWELGTKHGRLVRHLSGGERRLVGLAASLAGDQEVLVLDEPTNELDPKLRARLWATLSESARRGRTVLLITHNVHEIENVVTSVLIMINGRVVAEGHPDALRTRVTASGDTVRVDVPSTSVTPRLREQVGGLGSMEAGGDHVRVSVARTRVKDLLQLIGTLGTGPLEDIRIVRPTLEDAYLHFVDASSSGARGNGAAAGEA